MNKASNFGVSSLTGDRPGICHALHILVSFNLAHLDESSLFTEYHGYDGDDHDGDVEVHPGEHDMHAGLPASQSSRTPVHDGFDQLPATVHCPALVAARSPSVAPPVTHRRRLPNAYATPSWRRL